MGHIDDPHWREQGRTGVTNHASTSTGAASVVPMTDEEKAEAAKREECK